VKRRTISWLECRPRSGIDNMKKKWTTQEEEYVISNYRKGKGLEDCARYLGRNLNTVKKKAKRLAVTRDRRNYTEEEILFVKENHPYLGMAKCAELLGVSKSRVNSICTKKNLGKMIPSFRSKIISAQNKTWERTAEMKANMSTAAKKLGRSKEKNPRWKGGISTLRSIVARKLWPVWMIPIFTRDNYSCKECGSGEKLNVHHIKKFTEIRDSVISAHGRLDDYQLADLIVIQHTLDMGITLCHKCHMKHHFGKGDELLETPNATGEDNQQPSQSNVRSIVDWKVQRLTLEESRSNKSDTSVPLAESAR
jgi:hypothetical protein